MSIEFIKPPVEILYKKELDALKENDKKNPKPENWKMSPIAVRTFILGSEKPLKLDGEDVKISKKYFGNDAMIERCIVTLAGNRGLMLVGEPGTAKTMISELLSAAISGRSTNTVQGSMGTTEDNIKYSWNYALLIESGANEKSIVPAPLYIGMENGYITRFEEITRCPAEVQDTLISVMSDKVLNIPEFGEEGFLFAKPGFNIIGTANTRDRGVNDMSSALKRRFNFETVQPINSITLEREIIENQAQALLDSSGIDNLVDKDVINIIATTFHELREGVSVDGGKIDVPNAVMSTAEAVSVYYQSALSSYYYKEKEISMDIVVGNMMGSIVKESDDDIPKIENYFKTVIKSRAEKEGGKWAEYYAARKWIK